MTVPKRNFNSSTANNNWHPELSIIGLGCSSFSTFFLEDADGELQLTQETAHKLSSSHPKVIEWVEVIHYAVQCGINVLDTAPWYGHGTSEVVIGYAMAKNMIDRHQIVINTKIGRYDAEESKQFDFSYHSTIESCRRSIDRMNCEYIDVLQLHDPEFCPDIDILIAHTIPAMIECKRRGWVKSLGLTGYPLKMHYYILERMKSNGQDVVFDQAMTYCQYNLHNMNLFSQSVSTENNGLSLMKYFKKCNLRVMCAAPLSMGLLTRRNPPLWHPASDQLKLACRDASCIAQSLSVDIATLALLFALAHDAISCTVIGMGTKGEVDQALKTARRLEAVVLNESTSNALEIDGINDDGVALRTNIILKLRAILTESEKNAFERILDPENGPFSSLWKHHEYDWDGFQIADEFWFRVNGGKEAAIQRMKKR